MITVEDTQAPELSSTPIDITVDCGNIPLAPIVTAKDNCVRTCFTGNGDSETNQGVGNPTRALGAPNNLYSVIAFGDWQEIDLTDIVPAGEIIEIIITRHNSVGRVEITGSLNGTSFNSPLLYGNGVIPAPAPIANFEVINYIVNCLKAFSSPYFRISPSIMSHKVIYN